MPESPTHTLPASASPAQLHRWIVEVFPFQYKTAKLSSLATNLSIVASNQCKPTKPIRPCSHHLYHQPSGKSGAGPGLLRRHFTCHHSTEFDPMPSNSNSIPSLVHSVHSVHSIHSHCKFPTFTSLCSFCTSPELSDLSQLFTSHHCARGKPAESLYKPWNPFQGEASPASLKCWTIACSTCWGANSHIGFKLASERMAWKNAQKDQFFFGRHNLEPSIPYSNQEAADPPFQIWEASGWQLPSMRRGLARISSRAWPGHLQMIPNRAPWQDKAKVLWGTIRPTPFEFSSWISIHAGIAHGTTFACTSWNQQLSTLPCWWLQRHRFEWPDHQNYAIMHTFSLPGQFDYTWHTNSGFKTGELGNSAVDWI